METVVGNPMIMPVGVYSVYKTHVRIKGYTYLVPHRKDWARTWSKSGSLSRLSPDRSTRRHSPPSPASRETGAKYRPNDIEYRHGKNDREQEARQLDEQGDFSAAG